MTARQRDSDSRPASSSVRGWIRGHRRGLLAGAGLGLVGILAAAAILVPLAMPHGSPDASPIAAESTDTPSAATATASPTPTPATSVVVHTPEPTETPAPTDAPSPVPSFKPIAANGWPVALPPGRAGEYLIGYWTEAGPDGTIYVTPGNRYDEGVTMAAAIGASGHIRNAWLQAPDGHPLPAPTAFGPDGSLYVKECTSYDLGIGYSACLGWVLYAFNPDGTLRYQTAVNGSLQVLPGPAGTLYTQTESGTTVLNRDGSVRSITSETTCYLGTGDVRPSSLVRPDGVLVVSCWDDQSGTSIQVFDPRQGSVITGPGLWHGLVMGADGTAVVWYRDLAPHVEETPDAATAIHLAVIGADGKPRAGWPITVKGSLSDPVVDPRGNIYVNAAATASEPARMLAFSKSGQAVAGWPAVLPMESTT